MDIGLQVGYQHLRLPNNSAAINRMADIVNILRKIDFDKNHFNVNQDATGLHVHIRASAAAAEEIPGLWDITDIVGAVVTIGVGAYRRAGEIVLTTPPTDVTVTADHDWIYWEYDPETNYVVVSPSTETGANPPYDASGKIRGPLYQMRYRIASSGGEVVSVERDWRHVLNTSQFAR